MAVDLLRLPLIRPFTSNDNPLFFWIDGCHKIFQPQNVHSELRLLYTEICPGLDANAKITITMFCHRATKLTKTTKITKNSFEKVKIDKNNEHDENYTKLGCKKEP